MAAEAVGRGARPRILDGLDVGGAEDRVPVGLGVEGMGPLIVDHPMAGLADLAADIGVSSPRDGPQRATRPVKTARTTMPFVQPPALACSRVVFIAKYAKYTARTMRRSMKVVEMGRRRGCLSGLRSKKGKRKRKPMAMPGRRTPRTFPEMGPIPHTQNLRKPNMAMKYHSGKMGDGVMKGSALPKRGAGRKLARRMMEATSRVPAKASLRTWWGKKGSPVTLFSPFMLSQGVRDPLPPYDEEMQAHQG